MTESIADVAVIGGGIAGVSVGAFLAEKGAAVQLFEMESSLAYHTTGRSAALFTPYYGPDSIRAFAKVAALFMQDSSLSENPFMTPQGLLSMVTIDCTEEIEEPPGSEQWTVEDCVRTVSILRSEAFSRGIFEAEVASIDVHELHSWYVRQIRKNGGQIHRNAEIRSLKRSSGVWLLKSTVASFRAAIVVNAAGAWGDVVAKIAGVDKVGLLLKRRTGILIDQNQFDGVDVKNWPMVIVNENYVYFQPFGKGRLMVSPSEAKLSPPCDAQPDELDVAVGVARFEEMTTVKVQKLEHSWTGLRTFAPDNHPVIGWDSDQEGFFWLVGQGGYGIFTSPGIGEYASCLITGSTLPEQFTATGYNFSSLGVERLRQQA